MHHRAIDEIHPSEQNHFYADNNQTKIHGQKGDSKIKKNTKRFNRNNSTISSNNMVFNTFRANQVI